MEESISIITILSKTWPMLLGLITLIIVLAKMHGDIQVIKEKIRTLFDLWNAKSK